MSSKNATRSVSLLAGVSAYAVSEYVAQPSLNQICCQVAGEIASPNHWWESSCACVAGPKPTPLEFSEVA